jgi:hypothetical protein
MYVVFVMYVVLSCIVFYIFIVQSINFIACHFIKEIYLFSLQEEFCYMDLLTPGTGKTLLAR